MQADSNPSSGREEPTLLVDTYYGKCRCCLSLGKHQYNFGKAELEMLMENLNLFLMVDPRLPHLLCSDCFTSLNEVQRFRQKVMVSEAELRQVITEEIKPETGQLSQNDPLELSNVKTEHTYGLLVAEQAITANSIATDDTSDTNIARTVKIEFESCAERSKDSKATVKTENVNSRINPDAEPKAKELVKPRRLRPQSTKGIRVVPISSKDLHLGAHGSKGLHLVPINRKDLPRSKKLCLVPISSMGLPLGQRKKRLLCVEPLSDIVSSVNNENEGTNISKDNRKRMLKDASQTTTKKKNSTSESDDLESLTSEDKEAKVLSMLASTETARHLLLIDNSKVRSNIILILKHSTVLPFRNNFKFAFKCFYCDKLNVQFKDLKEHIELEHSDISLTTISKIVRAMQNLIVTADISCIKCRICGEQCDSIENLIQHLCNAHDKVYHETDRKPSHGILGVDLSTDTLKCHICNQDHTFFKNLLVHMNEHYGVFVCYVCGKKFLSERRYKSHVISTHADKEIKCKQCSKIFKTEPAMKYHVKRVHLKTRVKCLYCSETFTSGNYVKRMNHMAEAHGVAKPIFKCDMCGKELANSASLAHHKMYTHKRTKVNRCEICGYMTCSNSAMKNHMIVHSGEKNYECEYCKKTFAKLGTLRLHLKIHLNDKRFVCFLCDAAFIQKNSLKNHLQSRHPDSGIDIASI